MTIQAIPDGHGTDNHEFEYSGSKWRYNLDTSNFTDPGTYQVQLVSGDADEYVRDPVCMVEFEIN